MDVDMQNIKKWVIIYPIYINSKKTLAEGRRINASKACENPTCNEVYDCCTHLKLPCAIESEKAYPRDFMQRGRVRVLLKRDDGTFYNPAISSNWEYAVARVEYFLSDGRKSIIQSPVDLQLRLRAVFHLDQLGKQLMLHVAELVPRHPGRTKKQEPATSSAAGSSKSGKGGKKKR